VHEACPPIGDAGEIWAKIAGRVGGEEYRILSTTDGGTVTKQLEWLIEYLEANKLKSVLEYEAMLINWKKYNNNILSFMKDYDIIISPVMPTPAMKHEDVPHDFSSLIYCCAWNVCGYPSVAIGNVGVGEGEYEGLPIGIQVIGSPFREDIVFAVSRYLQNNLI